MGIFNHSCSIPYSITTVARAYKWGKAHNTIANLVPLEIVNNTGN